MRGLGRLGRALDAYDTLLRARPLSTKARAAAAVRTKVYFVRLLNGRRVCRFAPQAVTSAVVSGLGDLTCQCAFEHRSNIDDAIDWRRFWTFSMLGGVMVGPVRAATAHCAHPSALTTVHQHSSARRCLQMCAMPCRPDRRCIDGTRGCTATCRATAPAPLAVGCCSTWRARPSRRARPATPTRRCRTTRTCST